MAQVSDYNIANASGASVRSDLNAVFGAIKTLNSGSSGPSNPEAFMLYVDTADNNNLKIRNSANNGYTTIGPVNTVNLGLLPLSGGTMTGQILADDASQDASPAYSFDQDPDTGMFKSGTNRISFAVGGNRVTSIDSNGLTINNFGGNTKGLYFTDADGSHSINLRAPDTLTSNPTLTLPNGNGSAGQFLQTDGSGNLSFATASTAASALTGNTLASGVTASSLTSVGTLTSLTVSGSITGSIASSNISGALFTLFGTSINRGSSHTSFSTITATNSRVTNLQDSSGGNNSTPNQIKQGRAKAWVNFNGSGSVAIRDDFNVSSISDNGSGDYTINFSSNMANSNYATVVSHNHGLPANGGSNTRQIGLTGTTYSTSGVRVTIELPNSSVGGSRSDSNRVTVAVFGDQ